MNRLPIGLAILLTLLVLGIRPLDALAEETKPAIAPPERPLPGYALVEARRRAISALPFRRKLDANTIHQWMEIGSRCTIAEFELFLGTLSPQEKRLLERIQRTPAPIVNRLDFKYLRGVLQNQELNSLQIEDQSRRAPIRHTTSAVENELYGAYECVFCSVGPPHGSPRYGDVILRFQDTVRENGWATPFSGMHFLSDIRKQPAAKMQDRLASGRSLPTSPTNRLSLGFDDRLSFSHYVVTEDVWEKALAYQAILVLRNLDDSESSDKVRQRFDQMLKEKDADKFWALFIPSRELNLSPSEEAARVPFGYLEAKMPNHLSLKFATSIEVSPEQLEQVRSWPAAKPYLSILRAKPNGVQ